MTDSHPQWCDKSDDPMAVALWTSKRPALLTVWCGQHRHRLAKVYDLAGGEIVCFPGFTFHAQAMELGTKDHGGDTAHMHAICVGLSAMDEREWQHCVCGIWLIRADQLRRARQAGHDTLTAKWTGAVR